MENNTDKSRIASSINIVDPNRFTQNNIEDLYIYVDFSAESRGNTIFNIKTREINTTDPTKANLMGYKENTKLFTTDYTEVYSDDGSKNIFEGFGIENIKIVVNSSYVPTVTITFVDIKGASFFNKGTSSPYSVLTMFPPPIFNLKVKGFYGATLEYKLHLLKYNTRFVADSGNFIVNADFVGNTFAPLADIIFRHVLEAPFLDREKSTVTNKLGPATSIVELISKSKSLNNELTKFYNNDRSTSFNQKKEKLKTLESIFVENKTFTKDELDEYGVSINKSDPLFFPLKLSDPIDYLNLNSIRIDNIDYYIVSKVSSDNNSITREGNNTRNFFIKYFLSDNIYNRYKDRIDPLIKIVNVTNEGGGTVKGLLINPVIIELQKIYESEHQNLKKESDEIVEEINNLTYRTLGFNPTVYNVFEIICNDVDILFNRISSTYNMSIDYMNSNENKKRAMLRKFNNSTLNPIKENIFLYPFPDIIDQNNKKTYPGSTGDNELRNMPENQLVDDFVSAFIDISNRRKSEQVKAEVNENGAKKWIPNNINDSFILNANTESPYIDNFTPRAVIHKLINRYLVWSEYTYNKNLLFSNTMVSGEQRYDVNNNNLFEFICKSEAVNLILSLNDPKLIKALINDLRSISSTDYTKRFNDYFNDFNLVTQNQDYYKWNNLSSLDIVGNNSSLGVLVEDNDNLNDALIKLRNRFQKGLFNIENEELYIKFFGVKTIGQNDFGITMDSNNILYYHDSSDPNKSSFVNESTIKNQIKRVPAIYGIFDGAHKYLKDNNISDTEKIFSILNTLFIPNTTIDIIFNFIGIIMLPKYLIMKLGALLEVSDSFIDEYVTYSKEIALDRYESDFNNIKKLKNKLNLLSETDKSKIKTYFNNNLSESLISYKKLTDDLITSSNRFKRAEDIETILDRPEYNDMIEDEIGKKQFFLINSIHFSNGSNLNQSTLFNPANSKEHIKKNRPDIQKFMEIVLNTAEEDLKKKLKTEEEQLKTIESSNIDKKVKQEIYYSFKNIVDRWFTASLVNENKLNNNYNYGIVNKENMRLIDYFSFIDRSSTNIGKGSNIQPVIDVRVLAEFEDDFDVNILSVMSKILGDNGFQFYPLQNFMLHTNEKNGFAEIFKVKTPSDIVSSKPRFTCMYIGNTSSYTNDPNANYYLDDAIDFTRNRIPNDLADSENLFVFRVGFGENEQSLFSGIELNTEEHQPTNESLKIMSQILDGKQNEATPLNITQNLFSVLEQRSYTCKIDMLGNAMIQPTQYFQLENVPLFRGGYIVLNVEHNIDGANNTMTTSFSGVRMSIHEKPFVTNPISASSNNMYEVSDDNSIRGSIQRISETSIGREMIDHNIKTGKTKFNPDYQISKYLKYKDVIRTSKSLNNEIEDYNLIDNAKNIGRNVYDRLYDYLDGNIVIGSFYRSPNLNSNLPGSSETSRHMTCEAMDLQIKDTSKTINGISNNLDLFNYVKDNFDFNQLINEYPNKDGIPSWVHIAYTNDNTNNRKSVITIPKG